MIELTDDEKRWYVFRVRVYDEKYFDTEEEARAYAKAHPGSQVEPPEKEPAS